MFFNTFKFMLNLIDIVVAMNRHLWFFDRHHLRLERVIERQNLVPDFAREQHAEPFEECQLPAEGDAPLRVVSEAMRRKRQVFGLVFCDNHGLLRELDQFHII